LLRDRVDFRLSRPALESFIQICTGFPPWKPACICGSPCHCGGNTKKHISKEEIIMSNETDSGNTASTKFESGKSHAIHAAEDLRAAAEAKAHELRAIAEAKAQEYRGKAEHAFGEARVRARTLREDGEQYVRENPTKAVFTALGIGFVLGLVFRR
jgi:ElaB/YqjD/DUF883 family membrane-anchored ribosome-binding protein